MEEPSYSTFNGGEKGFYLIANLKNIGNKLAKVKLLEYYLVSDGRKWEPKYFYSGYRFEEEDIMPDTIKSVAKIWCEGKWSSSNLQEDDYIVIEILIKNSVKQMYKFIYTSDGWRKNDFYSVKVR